MRWIALLATAVLLIAAIWALSGGDQQESVAPVASPDDAAAVSENQPASPDEVGVEHSSAPPVSPAAQNHGFAFATPPVQAEPRRPLQLRDTVVSEMLPIEDPGSAGAVGTANESTPSGSVAAGTGSSGTVPDLPPELQGPGGDTVSRSEVGPGQLAPAVADSDARLGPEFDDVSTLAPEFQDVDVELGGPGSAVATEPLPGPGSDSTTPAGPGPGYDDPRTPPPTEPDGVP